MSNKVSQLPEISVRIGKQEIPLQTRLGAMLKLMAQHQSTITSSPTMRVIFDCGPGNVSISLQTQLGRVKVSK